MNRAQLVVSILRRHYGENERKYREDPFLSLVSGILSQNTNEANASKALKQLLDVASTPQEIIKLSERKLKQLIRSSGYFNVKARYIREASKAIIMRYEGIVPDTREELMDLPGVGPKTADIVLNYGFNKPAIAVDTHIHRTAKRLGLASESDPLKKVKQHLEEDIPPVDWVFTDEALLSLGKDYCKSHNPLCIKCPLSKVCNYKKNKF